MSDRLLELAKKTNRYSVCDCGRGIFEVFDGRRLLDSLLQWQAVLPFSEETGLGDFEELRKQQSKEPALNDADQDVLDRRFRITVRCLRESRSMRQSQSPCSQSSQVSDKLAARAAVFYGQRISVPLRFQS